ncbi:MAG: DDE-type integrase/transposase/recombinase [Deltaproteobacteria bacterium]|nr:DDE-type integrase/transposase/recombinase [Deltaproteobacteria bacterium]MBI3388651.1 DDE-type integrase/transposase/recombinase [Deltaproteobacteria bacterium]
MNRLPLAKRAQILSLLCEGSSMRSVSRLVDVSINTVTRELILAGQACTAFHDQVVRNVNSKRIQCDEIWSFCYSKAKNVPEEKRGKFGYGDVWTWTAIDADSKLCLSWFLGGRDAGAAYYFMMDLSERLTSRVQLTTDGHKTYLSAVESAFGIGIDYAMLVKIYGASPEGETRYSPAVCIGTERHAVTGDPDPEHISTSYVERSNLTMRMHMRRFTRLTNAFSKKIENHGHMVALYTVWYNFVRIHKTLRMSPAMAAGVTSALLSMENVVEMVDQWEAAKKTAT